MKANLNQTTLKAKLTGHLGFLIALVSTVVLSVAPSKASAAPSSQQYALVQSAVDAQIAQTAARVAAAKALMHGPFFLRTVGAAQLALSMSELSRLTSLKKQTTDAQIAGTNPPQAAVDLAMKQAAARMSVAVASRNYALLGLYSAQVAQIASLNQAIQQGNAYVAATPLNPNSRSMGPAIVRDAPITPATYVPAQAPDRRPASESSACERRGSRMICYQQALTVQ